MLRPVPCRLITTIIKHRKKDIGKIEESKNTAKRLLGFGITLLCICVDYICVLFCVIVNVIISMYAY